MNWAKSLVSLLILAIGLISSPNVQAMSSSNYRIDAYEINSFGGVGSSTNYKLVTSGGEPFMKEGSSANYKLGAAFPYEISYGMKVSFLNNGVGIYQNSQSSDVSLGNVQSGSPVTASTDIKVTTDAPEAYSYNIAVNRNDPDTTLDLTTNPTINIPDKTGWDPTANTGNGNAAIWSGTGLGFTVFSSTATKNTTWWGTGTTKTDANNKYAGFPSTAQTIMNQSGYTSGETTTSVGYKLGIDSGQRSGYYDGIIIFTVTMAL